MNCQASMKIFNYHKDLVTIIKYLMFIIIANDSPKAVSAIYDAMYAVICNCCHVFTFLNEKY